MGALPIFVHCDSPRKAVLHVWELFVFVVVHWSNLVICSHFSKPDAVSLRPIKRYHLVRFWAFINKNAKSCTMSYVLTRFIPCLSPLFFFTKFVQLVMGNTNLTVGNFLVRSALHIHSCSDGMPNFHSGGIVWWQILLCWPWVGEKEVYGCSTREVFARGNVCPRQSANAFLVMQRPYSLGIYRSVGDLSNSSLSVVVRVVHPTLSNLSWKFLQETQECQPWGWCFWWLCEQVWCAVKPNIASPTMMYFQPWD